MKSRNFILFYIIMVTISGCSAYYKMFKNAEQYEKAGSIKEAADCYYQCLQMKPNNEKARANLNNCGQRVVEMMESDFQQLFQNKRYDQSYQKYNEMVEYKNKLSCVGVRLNIKASTENTYNQNKEILANKHYEQGLAAFNNKKWIDAINEFDNSEKYAVNFKDRAELKRIAKENQAEIHYIQAREHYDRQNWILVINELKRSQEYVSNYKDSNTLLKQAEENRLTQIAEQHYQEGKRLFDQGRFKEAYNKFEKCQENRANYKDSNQLLAQALEKGKIRIGILPFKNSSSLYGYEQSIYSRVLSRLVNSSSKWIQYLDRTHLDKIFAEQTLGMSGVIDERTAAQSGQMIGLQYIVIGNISNAAYYEDGLHTKPETAWKAVKKKWQGQDIEVGQKVNYYIHSNANHASIEFSYQIIDTKTGQIVNSEVLSSRADDFIEYARYDGDPKELLKDDPTPEWYKNPPQNANIAQMQLSLEFLKTLGRAISLFTDKKNIFYNRSTLKPSEQLFQSIINDLSNNVYNSISYYFDKFN